MVLFFLVFIDQISLILSSILFSFFTTFAFFIEEDFKDRLFIFLIFIGFVVKIVIATTKQFSLIFILIFVILLIPNILRPLLAFKVFFIHGRKFKSKQLRTCLNLLRICLFRINGLNNCLYNIFLCHVNAFVCFEDLTFDLGIVHT